MTWSIHQASVNHHELVQETRRCIQTFQKLKSQEAKNDTKPPGKVAEASINSSAYGDGQLVFQNQWKVWSLYMGTREDHNFWCFSLL